MKGQQVRVEARLDGTIAARFNGIYLEISPCGPQSNAAGPQVHSVTKPIRKDHNRGGRSGWMQNFNLRDRKPLGQLTR